MKKIKNNMNKFILITLLACTSVVSAQQIDVPAYYSKEKSATPNSPSTFSPVTFSSVELDKGRNGFQALNEETTSAKLYLKLDLGDDYVSIPNGIFTYSISIAVGGTGITPQTALTLTINERNPEQIIEVNLLNDIVGSASNIIVTGTSIVTNYPAPTTSIMTDYITNNVKLTATFVREYGVDVRLMSTGVMAPGVPLINPVPAGRFVPFKWNVNSSEEFSNYEVQVLRLYNTSTTISNSNVTAVVDWNKALRVETQSSEPEIDLTVAEGSGFYIWRVRPIGNFYPGGIANQQNYGVWNSSSLIQGSTALLTLADVANRNDVFRITDPDENINWIYNRVFTEGNAAKTGAQGAKVSEGMSYADGLLRARQTQAYNSSNDTTLVTQTISDYSGRPALTTLPVPVAAGLTGYKVGFVKNTTTNTLYTAANYDDGANIEDPQVIKQTGTDFKYYDGTQSNGVADAEGYAFKRTLFKTDGTGRVDEESGVGQMHALGTQGGALGGGRTTRILFGTPSDDELLRIFGDEAPLAESVIKTLTIDPNNVVSTTYTSKEGKTIATALISNGTDNLLPTAVPNPDKMVVKNTANQNISSNNKMISSRRIALEVDKDVTLTYTSVLLGGCGTGDCNLKVRFYLNDLTNGEVYVSDDSLSIAGNNPFNIVSTLDFTNFPTWRWVNLNTTTGAPAPSVVHSGDHNVFNLPKGEYIITKEVFSANDPNFVEEAIIAQSELYAPILNAFADKMASISNPDAYTEFQTNWLPKLSDLLEEYQDLMLQGPPLSFPATITGVIDQKNVEILDSLGLVLGVDVDASYYVPLDINFSDLGPGDDAQQNTLSLSLGGGGGDCVPCAATDIAVPKPEICPACEGLEEGGAIGLTAMLTSINDSIQNGDPLKYGIEDIRMHTSSVFNDGIINNWDDIYTNAPGSSQWRVINKIVGYRFMDYLYRKLFYEGFPTNYNPTYPASYSPSGDPNLQGHLNRLAPGFTNESLQFMITNMLISKYYTGQSKLSGSKYYRAKENEHGWLFFVDIDDVFSGPANNAVITRENYRDFHDALPPLVLGVETTLVTGIDDGNEDGFNYDCKQLFECWMQAVDLIDAFGFGDDINVMDSFNDEEGGNSSEEHFDDDDSKEDTGGWPLSQILDMIISSKMRDFQNSDEGNMSKERLEAITSLPKIFMECAGYNYANILDKKTTVGMLPKDYSANTPMGVANFDASIVNLSLETYYPFDINLGKLTPLLVERAGNTIVRKIRANCSDNPFDPKCNDNTLYYQYTIKPEWMFKYFVYNSYTGGAMGDPKDDFIPILNQFQVELNSCYQNVFEEVCGNDVRRAVDENILELDDNPNCGPEVCRYYHESWSAGQRLNFYKQIIGARKCPESCNPLFDDVQLSNKLPKCVKEDLVKSADNQLLDVKAACDYRRGEFKSNIIAELLNGCWEIVTCATEPYHITEAQIDVMVDGVVASCQLEVDGVQAKLDSWDYNIDGIVDINGDHIIDVPVGGYGEYLTDFPTCIDQACFYVDMSSRSCKSNIKRTVTYFPECDQLILDQINSWNFEPSIGVADFNGNGNYGLNADGTLKDDDDANGDIDSDGIPNCPNYVKKHWKTTTTVACTEHVNCSNVRCVQVTPAPAAVSTYSTTHSVPAP